MTNMSYAHENTIHYLSGQNKIEKMKDSNKKTLPHPGRGLRKSTIPCFRPKKDSKRWEKNPKKFHPPIQVEAGTKVPFPRSDTGGPALKVVTCEPEPACQYRLHDCPDTAVAKLSTWGSTGLFQGVPAWNWNISGVARIFTAWCGWLGSDTLEDKRNLPLWRNKRGFIGRFLT